MGLFLNSVSIENDFTFITKHKYFVDKSGLIEPFNELIKSSERFVSITRPRRFGKTINALMLASYYSNAIDTKEIFDGLAISKCPSYFAHLNKHNVIFISFNTGVDEFESYKDYISYFRTGLIDDLKEFYPNIPPRYKYLSNILDYIYKQTKQGFIFIIDEWDYIFENKLYSEDDRKNFLQFLTVLLKDKSYIDFAYITGILPIAKYSNSTSLNSVQEYNAINDTTYEKYFGFIEDEVEELCKKQDKISMQELREWYNGYYTSHGNRLYNPRSVVYALRNGVCESYWTNSGKKKELLPYISANVAGIKDDIINMLADNYIRIRLSGSDIDVKDLTSRNLLLSALTILGYLSYHNMELRIPNKELMLEFKDTLTSTNINGLSSIIAESDAMLKATLRQDTQTMEKLLEDAHARYLSYFDYCRENTLACIITLLYLSARDTYTIGREDVSGIGRADFIFYPLNKNDVAFIIELKVDDTPEAAISQIIDNKYDAKLSAYTGKKLAIGISYYKDKDNKKHSVVIKELQ